MAGEKGSVSLGDFDGATTFPIAMPVSLFAMAAIVVSAISQRLTRVFALSLAAIANIATLAIVLGQLSAKSNSALDPQLDRLTGIANTHGIKDLGVSIAAAPWLWAVSAALTTISLMLGLFWQRSWKLLEKVDKYTSVKHPSKKTAVSSTIEIWDSQRD